MKICFFAIPNIPLGKHNIKDPRLDEADRLVEAKKKTYVQIDAVPQEESLTADAILVPKHNLIEVIFLDLEFVETRLGRNPSEAEKTILEKLKSKLEMEITVANAGLTAEEFQIVGGHNFHTNKSVITASPEELENPEALLVRAYGESGYISYLTVGGKENRAWSIRKGTTAFDAAGVIHTDIQKGFIRAEVISYADFVEAGGEVQAKRANKQRLEIKTYVMQDYDVVNFRFNK